MPLIKPLFSFIVLGQTLKKKYEVSTTLMTPAPCLNE